MPDRVTSGKSIYVYAKLPLKARLKALWDDRRIPEFYSAVLDALEDKVVYTLKRKYPNTLSLEDLHDCFSEALESFIEREQNNDKEPVHNPEGFIWGATAKIAITLIRNKIGERQGREGLRDNLGYTTGNRHKQLTTNPANGGQNFKDSIPIPERSAIVLLEDLYDNITAEEPWSVKVVREAVSCLTPALRKVAEHMLIYGHDSKSPEALKDLGMPANTYRSYRKRSLDELKKLIPDVMDKKGYKFRRVPTPEVFTESVQPFPSGEEDSDERYVDYTYTYEDENEET